MLIRKGNSFTAIAIFLSAVLWQLSCAGDPRIAKRSKGAFRPNYEYSVTNPKNLSNGPVDAIPSPVTGAVKVSTPYEVNGVTYYPLASADGYVEEGVASWYGPNFHAKKSANGEIYDQMERTCAHLTLPFNVMVKVENLENGKSTTVRVNDRGPFAKDRIIDLSNQAAIDIDMVGKGTAKVRLTALTGGNNNGTTQNSGRRYSGKMMRRSPSAPAVRNSGSDGRGARSGEYYIQAGSYSRKQNAERITEKIPAKYRSLTTVDERETSIGTLHRVVIGPFPDRGEAAKAARDIKMSARTSAIITNEP
ncbi:MAG: septal ring lytic transglycosylase RlpA family protein [Nitrospinota bacterium]|nr:septal ring lytic transglycosylase RlpA family protein [Nitrospinota bacterium]